MAGFCSNCGRPLPDDGVCPCTIPQPTSYQAPDYAPPRKGPSAFGLAMKNLPRLLSGYFKNPVRTSQLAAENRDFLSGLLLVGFAMVLTLFGTLFFALVHLVNPLRSFGSIVPQWLVISLFAPAIAVGVTTLAVYCVSAVSGLKLPLLSVLSAVGVNCILPTLLLALSMVASLISPIIFELLAVMMVASWVLSFFMILYQVFGVRLNILSILVGIACLVVGFYIVSMLLGWFLYDGMILSFAGLLV